MTTIVILAGIFVLGYILSVALRPWKICPSCKGAPRNYGTFYTKAFKLCSRCGGSGRVRRWGAREE